MKLNRMLSAFSCLSFIFVPGFAHAMAPKAPNLASLLPLTPAATPTPTQTPAPTQTPKPIASNVPVPVASGNPIAATSLTLISNVFYGNGQTLSKLTSSLSNNYILSVVVNNTVAPSSASLSLGCPTTIQFANGIFSAIPSGVCNASNEYNDLISLFSSSSVYYRESLIGAASFSSPKSLLSLFPESIIAEALSPQLASNGPNSSGYQPINLVVDGNSIQVSAPSSSPAGVTLPSGGNITAYAITTQLNQCVFGIWIIHNSSNAFVSAILQGSPSCYGLSNNYGATQ